jgi:hypothetical protein
MASSLLSPGSHRHVTPVPPPAPAARSFRRVSGRPSRAGLYRRAGRRLREPDQPAECRQQCGDRGRLCLYLARAHQRLCEQQRHAHQPAPGQPATARPTASTKAVRWSAKAASATRRRRPSLRTARYARSVRWAAGTAMATASTRPVRWWGCPIPPATARMASSPGRTAP